MGERRWGRGGGRGSKVVERQLGLPHYKYSVFLREAHFKRWATSVVLGDWPWNHTPTHCSLRKGFQLTVDAANSGDRSLRNTPYLDFASVVLRCAVSAHVNSEPHIHTAASNPPLSRHLFLKWCSDKSAHC